MHPPTSYVTWRGNLYLVDWDGKPAGIVNVHDGVRWGFDAGCITVCSLFSRLLTSVSQTAINLFWPTNAAPAQVQSSTNLSSTSSWSPVTNAVAISNGMYNIMNTAQGSDTSIVILTPFAPLTPNAQFFFQVNNVTDLATPPNTISPNPTFSSFMTGP